MKSILALILVASIALIATTLQAQDYPTYGKVTYGHQGLPRNAYHPIYMPGTNQVVVAPNGAIHSYYAPGHATLGHNQEPAYYVPAFRSYYQAPGSLHYYYGVYK